MKRTRITALAATAAIAIAVPLASVATANAATVTCTSTHTYSHSTTAKGTQTWTWTTKRACGHDYQKWERKISDSYTGAHYTENLYRNELAYPHWYQHEVKNAVSAKGTVTVTVTNTSG